MSPTAALRCCSVPGCPALSRSGRCEQHAHRAWDHGGRSSHTRGYGSHWRRIAALILQRDPVCTACHQRASTTVDHVVPKCEGGTDDETNLRGVCARCQQSKAGREGRRAQGIAREILPNPSHDRDRQGVRFVCGPNWGGKGARA